MTITLYIAGCVAALGLGIWLGLPGRYEQTPEEIERIMAEGGRRRRKTKTMFTPLAWVQRKASASRESRGSSRGRGFKLEQPEDR